ncbi:PDPFL protein, partial [Ramphastos sulfuratus]|nr:PDPFL protein [Ramphastos sulfuratus]
MASVPSAGCLLAKNQYYRSKSLEWGGSCLFPSSPRAREPLPGGDRLSPPSPSRGGLPDIIDKYWWIKSFFHNEPSPPTVGRKTLSAF